METALQLKGVPTQLKSLIRREAENHRRTLTKEAIVLLEEAVAARASTQLQTQTRDEIDKILDRYEKLPTKDTRPMADLIEYDELGLPQ